MKAMDMACTLTSWEVMLSFGKYYSITNYCSVILMYYFYQCGLVNQNTIFILHQRDHVIDFDSIWFVSV